jgi:hypothetical protein
MGMHAWRISVAIRVGGSTAGGFAPARGTYSPEDNKLRLYSSTRLDRELYARVRGTGLIYAPKQELFVAPVWTPERETSSSNCAARLTTKTRA